MKEKKKYQKTEKTKLQQTMKKGGSFLSIVNI